MGRAMLIICAGVLVSLGIIGLSTADQGKMLNKKTVTYFQQITAQNAAHTAIQIAMQKINKDSTWISSHNSRSKAWTTSVNEAQDSLYVKYINADHATNDFWKSDSLRIVSWTTISDTSTSHPQTYKAEVTSVYLIAKFSNLVPDFKSPLSIATNNFTLNSGGSASINGNAPSGSGCSDKPGVTVQNTTAAGQVKNNISSIDVNGTSNVAVDSKLSYQPTDQLIARLKNTQNVTYISGSYKGTMGTKDNPGVYFVNDSAKLTGGISEGYGILVIRTAGDLAYEKDGTQLDLAGNFTFNGLVVFENAYNFDGSGTPTINGSVLVGNTNDYSGTIDIDITGNLSLQYDCRGENYAKKAAANAVKQNKYTRVVTYESRY